MADAVLAFRAVVERRDLPCDDAADFTDDGIVQLGDAAILTEYLIKGVPEPLPPFAAPGEDPTPDGLGCAWEGDPPVAADGSAAYSLSVLPPSGGLSGFRLRVRLESTETLLGGRIVLKLPDSWGEDAVVLDTRASLELTAQLEPDGLVTGMIGTDRRLRCVWMLSRSDFTAALPAGGPTALFDVTVCGGSSPAGSYTLEGESAEAVTPDGVGVPASVEGASVELEGPMECQEPVEATGSTVRPYVWISDARAEPGESFRVSFWSTTSFESRNLKYRLDWDPEVIRGVWAEWMEDSDSHWVRASISNDEKSELGTIRGEWTVPQDQGPGQLWICHPCTNELAPSGVVACWGYPLGSGVIRRPYPADTEIHHIDLIFQVLPGVSPGETWIELYDDPTTPFSDNYACVFREKQLVDEIKYPARPQLPARVEILPSSGLRLFRRGDVNDDGVLEITDAVVILTGLFAGGSMDDACLDAWDSNDDGEIDLSDAVYTLSFLFLGGRVVPAPFFFEGTDWSQDDLPCD